MIQTILALALSAAAGYVLYRKRVPAGMLIGAVIAAAVLTAVFHAGTSQARQKKCPGDCGHLHRLLCWTHPDLALPSPFCGLF